MTGHVVFVVDKIILKPDFLRVLYPLPSNCSFISALTPIIPVLYTTDLIGHQIFIASFDIWNSTSIPLSVSTQNTEVNVWSTTFIGKK